jgi:aminomethyltransferase
MNLPHDYQAALTGAALIDEPNAGRILMHGRDRAALLQRLTTNDIERLRPGHGLTTVLTTPIGRIIDLLAVYARDDSLVVLTSPGQGPAIFSHLKKNIFFNDQVTLEPAGRSLTQFGLFGPQARAILETINTMPLPDLALHQHTLLSPAAGSGRVIRRAGIGAAPGAPSEDAQGWTLLIPSDAAEALRASLLAAGVVPLSATTYEALRVEAAIPAFGHELSQEYIPLETGLLGAISFNKGCYVGQEIIARMESRGRRAKQLCLLTLSAPADAPAKLAVEGKEAGDLTSSTNSPRHGPLGLAYVRSAHAEVGSTIAIANSDVHGQIVAVI